MTNSPDAEDADLIRALRSGFPTKLPPDDAELNRLVEAVRRVHDTVVGVQAPAPVVAEASALLERAADLLRPHRMRTDGPPSWDDLRRTAQTRVLNPPLVDVVGDRDGLTASVTYTSYYVGGNGAVHGGAIPLLFDEVLGRLANTDRPICRTAYLNVDFRRVTPVGRPLRVEARFEREEGRKRYLYGSFTDGEHLTAEAHGLFVELREGAA